MYMTIAVECCQRRLLLRKHSRIEWPNLMARSTIWADKWRLWQKGWIIWNRWSPDSVIAVIFPVKESRLHGASTISVAMSKAWRTGSNWGACCGDRFPVREPNVSPGDSRLESRNHSHSTGFEMPRLEDLWDMEQYFKAVRAPFFWRPRHNGNNLSLWGCEEYLKRLSNHHTDSDPTTVRTEWKGKKGFYAQTWKLYQ